MRKERTRLLHERLEWTGGKSGNPKRLNDREEIAGDGSVKAMKIRAGGTILLAARVESANETGADDCAISRGSRASVIDLAMFVVQRPDPRPRKTPRELHAPQYLCVYAIHRWIRKMPLYDAHAISRYERASPTRGWTPALCLLISEDLAKWGRVGQVEPWDLEALTGS